MKYLFLITIITILLFSCKKSDNKIRTYYANGNVKEEYVLINNKMNGLFCRYYDTGEIEYKVDMKDNFKNGIESYFYKTEKLKHKGGYTQGKRNGFFNYYNKFGNMDSIVEYVLIDEENPFSSYIRPNDYNNKMELVNRKIVFNSNGKINALKSAFFNIKFNKDTFNIGDSVRLTIEFILKSKNNSKSYKVIIGDEHTNKSLISESIKDNIIHWNFLKLSSRINSVKGMILETDSTGATTFFYFNKHIVVR